MWCIILNIFTLEQTKQFVQGLFITPCPQLASVGWSLQLKNPFGEHAGPMAYTL